MKICLSGGGSGGPVTPLLGLVETLRQQLPTAQYVWIGTRTGPEQQLVQAADLPFFAITAGKLRRYISIKNLATPFQVLAGFFQSLKILQSERPDVIISAGAFVSVPTAWAARWLKIPVIIHQQDLQPGLANTLMAKRATRITVTFEQTLAAFPTNKTSWTGNLIRPSIVTTTDAAAAQQHFGFSADVPVVLVVGGGTGAAALNAAVAAQLDELTGCCQVLHITGQAKAGAADTARYVQKAFLGDDMRLAYAAADVVVSRGGLGTLTELAALGKASVIVPMPDTHQEANATFFAQRNAVRYLPQDQLSAQLVTTIKQLLDNRSDRQNLERNINKSMKWGANEVYVQLIEQLVVKR